MNTCTAPRSRPLPPHRRPASRATRALQRRNALVEAHQQLVGPVASHYSRRCAEPKDDLIQVGLLGLIRAAELFNDAAQTPFSAFARPHIRGAILHYLRDEASPVRLPRRQAELGMRLHRLEGDFPANPKDRSCPQQPPCEGVEMSSEQWQLLQRHRRMCRPTPLDSELAEQLASPADEPQEDWLESQARVDQLLMGLDPRTQQVIRSVVLQDWSYRRTAATLDVSAMTVQRCLHSGLGNLRQQLSSAHLPPTARSVHQRGPAPSAAQGWPSRHSPPPAGAPTHRAKT